MTKAKKPVIGRPSLLTPAVTRVIVKVIKAGNYVETAVAAAGISKETFYDWLKKGEKEKSGPHRDFSDAVEKAKAEAEMRDVAIIDKAAKSGQWQAAAWRLERKNPARWGRRTEIEIGKSTAQNLGDAIAKVLSSE